MSKKKKKKVNKKPVLTDWCLCVQLSIVIALELWGGFSFCKKIDRDRQIVKQELVNIRHQLENKDLDIYTRVELHRQENILTYYNESFSEYRQLKRQILREYRQKARSEKVR